MRRKSLATSCSSVEVVRRITAALLERFGECVDDDNEKDDSDDDDLLHDASFLIGTGCHRIDQRRVHTQRGCEVTALGGS